MLQDLRHDWIYFWITDAMKRDSPPSHSAFVVDRSGLRLVCEVTPREERIVLLSDDDVPSDSSGRGVILRAFNRHDYEYMDIWLHIDQLVDLQGPYRDVDPAHVGSLKTRLFHFG